MPQRVFEQNGLPEIFRSDDGAPFNQFVAPGVDPTISVVAHDKLGNGCAGSPERRCLRCRDPSGAVPGA